MIPPLRLYLGAWAALCLLALCRVLHSPGDCSLLSPSYRRSLLKPWKLATFAAAGFSMTLAAPYTGDPTWDRVDAGFMSALAFATAPWAVGTLYLAWKGRATAGQAFTAACVYMFSVSWSYDLYLLLRDGVYPPTWLANIFASSAFYIPGGLLWSLDWTREKGVFFSFTEPGWPRSQASPFSKVLWPALALMALPALIVAAVLWAQVHRRPIW